MKLEDMMCSFDQAEKLEILGIKINTQFEWWVHSCGNADLNTVPTPSYISVPKGTKIYSAPTVAELGVLLPVEIVIDDTIYNIRSEKMDWPSIDDGKFLITVYKESDYEDIYTEFLSESEAIAKGDCLIWLIEDEIIKAEDLRL